ncbi:hypothetical protein ABKN59_004751 [Abortiporus biennis]
MRRPRNPTNNPKNKGLFCLPRGELTFKSDHPATALSWTKVLRILSSLREHTSSYEIFVTLHGCSFFFRSQRHEIIQINIPKNKLTRDEY